MLELIRIIITGVFIVIEGIRDLRQRKISMGMVTFYGALAIFIQAVNIKEQWFSILGGILVGVFLLLLSKITRGKIGEGDAWILIVTGISLGFRNNLILLLLSLWVASVVSIFLLLFQKVKRKTEMPFVFFMIPGYIWLLLIVR